MARAEKQHTQMESSQFFNFSFFRVDPAWRWVKELEKEEAAKKLDKVIRSSQIKFRSYVTIGLRDDTEFLFWLASDTVERFQEVMSKIYLTLFGRYIFPTHVYLSSTRPSFYAKISGGHGWLAGEEQKKIRNCLSIYQKKRVVPFTSRKKKRDDE